MTHNTVTTIPETSERGDTWAAMRQLGPKPYPAWDYDSERHTIRASVGLHKLAGNETPYFSATAAIYRGRRDEGGGAMTEEITRIWPEAELVCRLHLSDWTGAPMHAIGNGLYHLRRNGGRYINDDPDFLAIAARHLRVSVEDAEYLHAFVLNPDPGTGPEWYRERLDGWLASSGTYDRWTEEAARAMEWIAAGLTP